jgi:hypothetical protein
MMKKLAVIVLLTFIIALSGHSQEHSFALHIFNPIATFQKAGAKIEFRNDKMGFLIMGIQYYGSMPQYHGTQAGLELRNYQKQDDAQKHENFIYYKAFGGHQQFVPQSGEGFFNLAEIPEGYYYGLGAGVGRHFNYNHFFIDINAGLKYALSTVTQDKAFYITGPASILDLHFNLGFQF